MYQVTIKSGAGLSTPHTSLTLNSMNSTSTSNLANECFDSAGIKEVSRYADAHALLVEFEEAILDADLALGLCTKCENEVSSRLMHSANYCCVALLLINLLVATKPSDKLSPFSVADAKCWVFSPDMPLPHETVYTFPTTDHTTNHATIEATMGAFSHFVYTVFEGGLVYDKFACM
jgi:hypothetical protein